MTMILPLTPFEEYLVHEDRPAFPCWNVGKFVLEGRLDPAVLERAWQETAAQHPLLRAALRRGLLGGLSWRIDEAASVPAIEVVEQLGPHGWPCWLPLDLGAGRGAYLYLAQSGERAALFAQFHHALVDGLGVVSVIEELLFRYAAALGVAVKLPTRVPALLRDRGNLGLGWLERLAGLPMQLVGLAGAAQLLLFRAAAPLVPHTPPEAKGSRVENYPAVESRDLSAEEFRELREAAKAAKVSVNEMIMRDLQAAIGAWRREQVPNAPLDWMRLGVPVLQRATLDRRMPACNLVSMVIIDRTVKSCGKRERLLRRAHEDMELIRRHRLGGVFWRILRLCRWMPGGIRGYTRREKVRATMVLTNFGRAFHHGPVPEAHRRFAVPGAVLTEVITAPVMRAGTVACLGVGVLAGRLHADLHYDPRVLAKEQAAALADEFVRQMELSRRGK